MFKIDNNKIHITRGDKATINLTIEDYIFKSGDKIEFRVYNKGFLNKPPVLEKEVLIEEEKDNIDIDLTSKDTTIGEPLNKTVTYWYEIELNNEQTIIGYDETGAKLLFLYPEGVEK